MKFNLYNKLNSKIIQMSIDISNFKQIFSEKNNTSILSGDITTNIPRNEGIYIPPIEESKNINIILGKGDDIELIEEIIKSPITNSNITLYDFENNIIRKYLPSRKTNAIGNTFITTERKSMLSNIIIPYTPETKNYLLITSYPGVESFKTELGSKFLSLDKLENFNSKNLTVITTPELKGYFTGKRFDVRWFDKKDIYIAVAELIFGKCINDSTTTLNGFLTFDPICEAMLCKSSSHHISMTCRTSNRVQINSSKNGEVTKFILVLQTSKPIDTAIFGSNSNSDIYTFVPNIEVLGSDKMSKIEDTIIPYLNLYHYYNEAQISKTLDVFFDVQKNNVYNFLFKNPMKEGIESLSDYENYIEFFTSIKDSLYTKIYQYMSSKHFPEPQKIPFYRAGMIQPNDHAARMFSC